MGRQPAISVEGASFARGATVVLEVEVLELPAGARTAVVGPNGSGKSTLLHGIAGLLRPRDGTVDVEGTVAYVLQSAAAGDRMPVTVAEVVAMGRYGRLGALRRATAADRLAVDRALERLELADLRRRRLSELSGGQRQRVLVAQGLAEEADVLLLDEPVAGLDIASIQRIDEVLAEEIDAGRTVVVATHDLAEAAAADHLVLLAGRVVATGPPATALTREKLAEAYGDRLLRLDGDTLLLDEGAHHHHHAH